MDRVEIGRKLLETVRDLPQLACRLSKPWHYRRQGVYYLRLRPVGSTSQCVTVSLNTRNRAIAMATSRFLQSTLRAFHLDNPNAQFTELAVHLKGIAEGMFETGVPRRRREEMSSLYSDWLSDLEIVSTTLPQTKDQAKATEFAARILQAAEKRLRGEPADLIKVIEELEPICEGQSPSRVTELRPAAAQPQAVLLSGLADMYLSENQGNMQASTVNSVRGAFGILAKALTDENGLELDLKTHTREDLVNLRSSLLVGRKPSTVNRLLTQLSTLLTWAVNNGYLDKAFHKGLKITKGAESARKAYSQDQVKAIMAHANSLPKDSWVRWGLSLGCITGARLAEIHQLTSADIVNVTGITAIDINDDDGKSLKNKHSKRLIPLVDGAYGFCLDDFLEFAQREGNGKVFDVTMSAFLRYLNEALREILGLSTGVGLSYHSLRHALASLMKVRGIPLGTAQEILGHSSQSITFDLYGGDAKMAVGTLHEALSKAFAG